MRIRAFHKTPPSLGRAGILWVFLALRAIMPATAAGTDAGAPLTSIRQIRELTSEQARAGLPVDIKAVATYSDPSNATLFIHDGTMGMFVERKPGKNISDGPKAGDQLEITGITGEGLFAPVIKGPGTDDPVVNILASGPLPEARRIDGLEMSRPGLDSDWISIETWVQEVMIKGPDVILDCHSEGCDFHILLDGALSTRTVPWELAETRVRARGVVATTFNRGHQMTARFLRVSSIADIQRLDPQRRSPDDAPLVRTDELMRASGPGPNELVRIRGVTTLALPGRGFFLQVPDGGIWVQTAQPVAATPGTVIEVVGWPRPGEMKPFIRSYRASVLGTSSSPTAISLKAKEALNASHDAEWVSVEAELLDLFHSPEGTTLELRDTGLVFRCLVPDHPKLHLPSLKPGSRLRIHGVSRITSVGNIILRVEDKLQILTRDASGVTLLAPPPFWTARNVSILATLIIAGLLAIYGINRSRRRKEQESQRRAFEAVLAERGRFAREIHDSLAQGLTSISLQLECVSDQIPADTAAAHHVENARSLVRDSLKEARRTVWNLRPLALGETDLVTALQRFASNLSGDGRIAFSQQIEGTPRPLPPSHEDTLLRIGQEALTNAVRHAAATEIRQTLRFGQGWVTFIVKDNGHGFDVVSRIGKGFGLQSMNERLAALGGSLSIDSQPGHGTEVSATLPT